MRPQHGEKIVEHWPARVHDVDAQLGVADQSLFKLERAMQSRAIVAKTLKVGRARRSMPNEWRRTAAASAKASTARSAVAGREPYTEPTSTNTETLAANP